MEFIEIDYNRELKALEIVLSDVKRPGDFYVEGTEEIPMPRVEVVGVGLLSFPIPTAQAEAIAGQATRAPYGRGGKTIVDTSVRNVWQIAPSDVKIGGKSWAASLEGILMKVKAGLGCQNIAVSAQLYKLLVYQPGGFFLAHRDIEKTVGMFGTLVVTLPSLHRGGALRIRHGDREVTIETTATDPSEISFAAFYADCEHEALPVEEGHRVCLVYNLIQEQSKGKQRALKAPDHEPQIEEAAAILDAYWKSPGAPAKIAWLLEHQYSPAGLSFSALKGADAAKCQVLLQAANRAKCAAHLGIVHIEESGGAEEHFHFGGGYREHYYDDEEDLEDDDMENGDAVDEDVDFTAVSVDSKRQYVDEWRDTSDQPAEFGQVPVWEGELLPEGVLDKEPPDEKRLTEASGNEGASYERAYHRAALVLWPAKRTIGVLLQGGVVAALPHLKRLDASGSTKEALAAARRVVKAWPTDPNHYVMGVRSPGPVERSAMIATLVQLKSAPLLEQFVAKVVTPAYDGSENTGLVGAIDVLGVKKASAILSALVTAKMPERPSECSELLVALAGKQAPSLRQVAEAAVKGLDGIQTQPEPVDFFGWWEQKRKRRRALEREFLTNLLTALPPFKGKSLCEAAAKKITLRPEVFPPVTLVVPAMSDVRAKWDFVPPGVERAIQILWTGAAEFLLGRSEVAPEPPADWRLDARLSCTCDDCAELLAFAHDASAIVHRFRVNKERRRHLHQAIDQHKLDMTHVTERSGSPQTLVCTKDRRTFNARMKEYRDEIAGMRRLLKLSPDSGAAAILCKRMETAVKAG